jgi:hypothetical protein
MKDKILFILLGESFRDGGCESRLKDTSYGYEKQKEATETHLKLINKLNKLNYEVNLAFNTYDTNFKKELLEWYPNIVYFNFTNEDYQYFKAVVDKSLQNILPNVNLASYKAIYLTRFDVYLKDYFIDNIFNPEWNTIMYTFTFHVQQANPNFPVVGDTMCFIPKKYFFNYNSWSGLINNTVHVLHHHCWGDMLKSGLSMDDMNLMINTLHNTNTVAGMNPLYRLNSRPETDDWEAGKHTAKYQIYDKKSNSIVKI